jgi:hypothetical protein
MEHTTRRRCATTNFRSLLRCYVCVSPSIEASIEIYLLSDPDHRRKAYLCAGCLERLREHFAVARLAEQGRRAKS